MEASEQEHQSEIKLQILSNELLCIKMMQSLRLAQSNHMTLIIDFLASLQRWSTDSYRSRKLLTDSELNTQLAYVLEKKIYIYIYNLFKLQALV